MKKILILAMLMACAAGSVMADRATIDPVKFQVALPMPEAPTIDGVIDELDVWKWAGGAIPGGGDSYWGVVYDDTKEDLFRGGALGDATTEPFDANDIGMRFWVGYDAKNLYVAVRVTDDFISTDDAAENSENGSTWMDDAVEVFVDGDNSNYETRDTSGTLADIVATGGQFVITANNAYRDAEAGNPTFGPDAEWYAQASILADGTGYEAEFRISLAKLGNPKTGDILGFTIGVDDDDDGAANERQLMWAGLPHTEVTYGNLLLGVKKYSAPKVATAPVVDGKINASEYAGAQKVDQNSFNSDFDINAGDDTFESTDLSYSFWAVHDADAVYVAVDVTDDTIVTDSADAGSEDGSTWEDDSAEILFDADNDNESGHSATNLYEGQFVMTANGAWRDNEANNPTFGANADWFAATSTTSKGYQIEFRVPKATLMGVADGATMGFDIDVNDDDGANREAQMNWNGYPHNELSYGDFVLAAGAVSVTEWALY